LSAQGNVGSCKDGTGERTIGNQPPLVDKIITALRTAVTQDNSLDKELTTYDDILAAYQLALKNYAFGGVD
jgi:hypothetical protein